MEIKVLGSGCCRCKRTFATVKQVIEEDNIEANIEYVTDIAKILDYNIMSMPAIVIDDKVVLNGQVLTAAQVRQILKEQTNK
jgi:small redox-active disulfide protein 2